jgi:hypothetical protein
MWAWRLAILHHKSWLLSLERYCLVFKSLFSVHVFSKIGYDRNRRLVESNHQGPIRIDDQWIWNYDFIFLLSSVAKRSLLPSASLIKKSEHVESKSENRFTNVLFINRNKKRAMWKEIYSTNISSVIYTHYFFGAYLFCN